MQTKRFEILVHAVLFSIGFTFVFMLLGMTAGAVGRFLVIYRIVVLRIAGIVLILFGLFMAGAFTTLGLPSLKTVDLSRLRFSGYFGSLIIGVAFSITSVICIGPVFGAVLALALSGTFLNSIMLSLAYSLGIAIPFLVVAAGIGFLAPYLKKMNKHLGVIQKIGGTILVVFGVLVLTGWLEYLTVFITPLSMTGGGIGVVSIPVAFMGGIMSFFSPCFFPLIPAYLSYMSGISVIE